MNLNRNSFEVSGIYGTLISDDGVFSCATLEHAFAQDDGSYAPIIPAGTYTCTLGTFTLENYPPGQYYQIMDVPGHTHVLIHFGNYNKNSDGCILVGATRVGNMITNSDQTFKEFMYIQNGAESFELVVK